MRNLSLRLFLISGFLLLSCPFLIAQNSPASACADAQPSVIGPLVVRAGQAVTYSACLVPPGISGHKYDWTISPAGDYILTNASNSYQCNVTWGNNPGPFTITVKETNISLGCFTELSQQVNVHPLLGAYFYYEFESGKCYNNYVNFTSGVSVKSPSDNVTYTWDFHDGTGPEPIHPTGATFQHVFPISGPFYPPDKTFTVDLTMTRSDGVTDMITDYVYVNPDKYVCTAAITPPSNPSCSYTAVHFSADPLSIPAPPPNTDNLVIESCDWWVQAAGSADPYVLMLHSYTGPGIKCSPDFDYTFLSPGTYNIKLIITNSKNCTNTTIFQYILQPTVPVANFSFQKACLNENTVFTDNSIPVVGTINHWYWYWDDPLSSDPHQEYSGSLPAQVTHKFTDLNIHNVTLTVWNTPNGCFKKSDPVAVQAVPSPLADFTTYNQYICNGDIIHFKDLSFKSTGTDIISRHWDFDDPTSPSPTADIAEPSHVFAGGPGSYNVTLTVTNIDGCSDTKPKTIVVSPLPTVSFINTPTGNGPYELLFHATASAGVSNMIHWEFGDGYTADGNDKTHPYAGPGPFNVTCFVQDLTTGCSNSITQVVTFTRLTPNPGFQANPQSACENIQIDFSPLYPMSGQIDDEKWTWGDGTFDVFPPLPCCPAYPNHSFVIPPGPPQPFYTFTVTREVNLTAPAYYAIATLDVTIYPNPTAKFVYFNGPYQGVACDGQAVSFNPDASLSNTIPQGQITEWQWDFGDPGSGANTSTDQYPTHTFLYSRGTSYNVTLKVKDNLHGCWSTNDASQTITIAPPINVTINFSDYPCVGGVITFTGNSALVPGDYDWKWEFSDDGTIRYDQGSVDHMFATAGTYNVTLTMTQHGTGCSKSTTVQVHIIPKPLVGFDFSPSNSCFGTEILFTSTSTIVPGTADNIASWEWDFDDGSPHSPGFLATVTHTYTTYKPAGWDVKLYVVTQRGCTDSRTIHVTQIPAPIAGFTTTGFLCASPQTVQFQNQTQTNGGSIITGYYWDFGDPGSATNNHSTATNPTHVYDNPGDYPVTLVAKNADGCTNTTNPAITIHINPLPQPDFTAPPVCLGENTIFTGSEPGPATITNWSWDFGDGNTYPNQNQQYLFTTAGDHSVTLTVTNSNGCVKSITKTVKVNPKPVAKFIFNNDPFCQHDQVTFTSQSFVPNPPGYNNYITTYVWDFGDGTPTQPGHAVTHTFTDNLLSHIVKLTVTTDKLCTDFISVTVTAIPAPIADFVHTGSLCLNQEIQFFDNSQAGGGGAPVSWLWNFDDPGPNNTSTLPNPTHVFQNAGLHNVSLTVWNSNSCSDFKVIPVTILDKPVVDFTGTTVCLGEQTILTATSPDPNINTWSWSFDDGGTASGNPANYVFSTSGMHTVILTVSNSNGCTQTKQKQVEVYPHPITRFSFSTPTCAGNSVTFTDLSDAVQGYITQRSWDFGDGTTYTNASPTATHTYASGGTYPVILTITTSASCTGTSTINVPIQYNPISGFQWSSTDCALSPVQFTSISQPNGGGIITQWNWTFGDPGSGSNNTSTQENPAHSFSAAATFTVHLKVTNASGCYKDSSAQIIIEANPTATFTATSVCKGSPTVFAGTAVSGTIVTWSWEFGDGGTGSGQNPSYTYTNPGTYTVLLNVTTSGGCHGAYSKTIQVYGSPVSQFSFSSPTCASDSVQFTDLSVTAHGSITKWEWDFGDGGNVTITFPASPNVKHKYVNGGNFNVKLKITTSDNCTNEIILPVSVEFKPIANFSNASGACALMPNEFTDLSQQNGGTAVVSWLWDFGDPTTGANNTSDQKNPTHAFSAGGPFWVKLQVTNATGCYDTLRKQISVNAAPSPKFTFDTACISSPTQFHDNSTSSTGTINAWLWNFGDPSSGANNTSTLQNPVHTYAAPGNYMVDLKVTNTNTCSRDTIIQIAVSPKPIALFQYNAACAQDTTYFTDLSIAPNSQIVAWNWDFGDGGTATTKNPAHKYATAGTFSVKEIVTNLSGCTDTVTVSVLVHVKPVAAYQFTSKYCPKGQVTFQDMSTATAAVITNRLWIFEQGATSTVANPVYTFPVTDTTYLVTLMVTDTYGCKDTIIDSVHVKPGFRFSFVDSTVCFGNPTIFHPVNYNVGKDSLYSPRWDFGDPNSGPANYSSLYNTTHVFTAPGLYNVKLRVFNSDNCVDSVFRTVQVYALPKPHFSAAIAQCDSVMHFTDTTSNFGTGTIKQWEWIFGDGSPNVIITTPPGDTSHWYVAPGDYQVTLIVTNTKGCVDSITQGVTRLPCIRANYNYPDTNCMNYMVTFTDTSVPTYRIKEWKWTWGDGKDTSYIQYSKFVVHKFTSPGTFQVKLWIKAVVNSKNILDSLTQQVLIHPTPKTLFSNVPVCLKQPAMFRDTSFTNGEPVSAWKWDFGEPSSIPKDTSTLKNPSHIYATRDTFNVKLVVMNRFGCKDSVIKPLRIYGLPLARFNYTAACTGDPTFFRDSSSISDTTIGFWRWKFNPTVLKDTSLLKDPSFKYKTAGDYLVRLVVRDYFGCKDTIDSTITVHVTPVSAFTLINGYDGTPGKVKLNNLSSGASGYSWDFGNGKTSNDTNPVASFTEDGTYTIRLISSNQFGCVDTTYYEYKILFRGLFIPNAFAPSSGNMAVRLFQPVGMNLKTYHIQVFDTWGHQIWESNKLDNNGAPLEGWDGTFNGALMPQGNYFWKVTATFVDDSPWTGSDTGVKGGGGTMGTVILLR